MTNGLVVMTPSSVDITGGGSETSTTNADGSVSFSACETLSLNGVFTSNYDNYMMVIRGSSTSAVNIAYRLRSGGVDNSTVSSYVYQYVDAYGTSIAAARLTSNQGELGVMNATQRCGFTSYFFGPFLAQPTASRMVNVRDYLSADLIDYANTHNQSISYDGISIISTISGVSFSGLVTVFGFNQ
jgi:hypothetical protein